MTVAENGANGDKGNGLGTLSNLVWVAQTRDLEATGETGPGGGGCAGHLCRVTFSTFYGNPGRGGGSSGSGGGGPSVGIWCNGGAESTGTAAFDLGPGGAKGYLCGVSAGQDGVQLEMTSITQL